MEHSEAELASLIVGRFAVDDHSFKTLSAKDLKAPTKELVIKIYLAYLKCMAIEITDYSSFEQTSHLTYVDAYNDVLPYMNLFFILRRIFRVCGVDDFSFLDLSSPTPKRFLRLISLFENFIAFYEMKQDDLAEDFNKLEAEKRKYEDLVKKQELLRQEINNRASERHVRDNNIEQLEKNCEDKSLAINRLLEQHKQASSGSAKDEIEFHSCKRKVEEINDSNLLKTQEIESLKKQVVPSPEQLTSQLKRLEELLETTNTGIDEQQEMVKAKKKQSALFEIYTGKATQFLKVLQQVKELQQKLERNMLETEGMNNSEKSTKLSEEIKKCQESNAMHLRDIHQLQEELAGLKLQAENREDSLKKHTHKAEADQLVLEVKVKETMRQYAVLEEQLAAMVAEGTKWLQTRIDSANYIEAKTKVLTDKDQSMHAAFGKMLDQEAASLSIIEAAMKKEAEEE